MKVFMTLLSSGAMLYMFRFVNTFMYFKFKSYQNSLQFFIRVGEFGDMLRINENFFLYGYLIPPLSKNYSIYYYSKV